MPFKYVIFVTEYSFLPFGPELRSCHVNETSEKRYRKRCTAIRTQQHIRITEPKKKCAQKVNNTQNLYKNRWVCRNVAFENVWVCVISSYYIIFENCTIPRNKHLHTHTHTTVHKYNSFNPHTCSHHTQCFVMIDKWIRSFIYARSCSLVRIGNVGYSS